MKAFIIPAALACTIILGSCRENNQPDAKASNEASHTDPILYALYEAIQQHPDSIRLFDHLIDTLTVRGNITEAIAWCDTLIQRSDSNFMYWTVKGDIYQHANRYDSAAVAYNTYLQRFPDDEQTLIELLNAMAKSGHPNTLNLSTQLQQRIPTPEMKAKMAFIRGVYYNTIKNYKAARHSLDSTLILNYNFSEAHMEKGYSYFDEGQYAEAYKIFSLVTELNNHYADAYYWMGKCDEQMGKKTDALAHYEKAWILDGSIAEAQQAIDRLKK